MFQGRQTGADAPQTTLRDRGVLGWDALTVYPGENLVARINGAPSNRQVFRLAQGAHELRKEWSIDRPVTIYGSPGARVVLYDDARVYLLSSLSRLVDVTFESDADHAASMVYVKGAACEVRGCRFWNANRRQDQGGTWYYPLQLDNTADATVVLGNMFLQTTPMVFNPVRFIYLGDTTDYCVVTGNRLPYNTFGLARDVISMKVGRDDECGQAATAPAGTYRSFCNYADVELRP